MGIYIGDSSSKARNMSNCFIGVDGKARAVKNIYIGDSNGKARLAWSSAASKLYANGNSGIIYVSSDGGTTWSQHSTGKYGLWRGDDGIYTAYNGTTIYKSTDMNNWSSCSVNNLSASAGGDINSVSSSNGLYFATCYRMGTYYSTNFTNWIGMNTGYTYGNYHCYNKNTGEFCLDSYDNAGTYYMHFYSSVGGGRYTFWSDQSYAYKRPFVAGNYFVILSRCYAGVVSASSSVAYTPMGYDSSYWCETGCYANGIIYVMVRKNNEITYLCKSSDYGATWTYASTNFSTLTIQNPSMYHYNNKFYITYSVFINNATQYHLAVSSDGTSWTDTTLSIPIISLAVPENNNGIY